MEVEVGIRELCKNFGFQDLIDWAAGMGGCREDICIPAVHGGRRFGVGQGSRYSAREVSGSVMSSNSL